MTLSDTKQLLLGNKWILIIIVGIFIFFMLIIIRFTSPSDSTIYEISTSPDLPKQNSQTKYFLNAVNIELPKTAGIFSQSRVDESTFNSIAGKLGLEVEPTTVVGRDENLLFWKKENNTLSISTSSFRLNYQKNYRFKELDGEIPTQEQAKSIANDYLSKINLNIQNINTGSPLISLYSNLAEDSSRVEDGNYKFVLVQYQPTINKIPIITHQAKPLSAFIGPGLQVYQLKADLTSLTTPLLEIDLKTKSIKSIIKSIESGGGIIINSNAQNRYLEPNIELLSFKADNTRLVYFKYKEKFLPVLEVVGEGKTNKGSEEITMIIPIVEKTTLMSATNERP